MKTKFYLVIIVLSIFKVTGFSQSGNFGENDALFWSFDPETSTLTISGEGEIPNYNLNDARLPWYDYIENIQQIEIQDGVTAIGNYTFSDHTQLIVITIPNSVERIKDYVFSHCSKLVSVVIPNSVISIGEGAFANSGLISIILSDNITQISRSTFCACFNLQSIEIPHSVTSIEFAAFLACESLSSVVLPNSLKKIDTQAFAECTALSSIKLPGNIKYIYDEAFAKSGLLSVEIPSPMTGEGLDKLIFRDCKQLQSAKLANSVVIIPGDLFGGCDQLVSLAVDRKNPPGFSSMPFTTFNKANCTLYIPADIDSKVYSEHQYWSGFKAYRPITEYNAIAPVATVNPHKVWIQDGRLQITTIQASQLEIYNLAGQLVLQEKIPAGITTREIPKGIFIVVVDGQAEKIRNF